VTRFVATALALALALASVAIAQPSTSAERTAALRDPANPLWNRPAPEHYRVRIDTTKGAFVLEVDRALAPHGADRFYHLVETGFYDYSRFFRTIAGRFVQFGIPGDPKLAQLWRNQNILADPEKIGSDRGNFGFAMAAPDARTTQIYISTNDSMKRQDGTGFAPFGKVVEGMDVVDALNTEYGERSGGGIRAGHQDKMFEEGNAYLDREFPKLDKLIRATLVNQ
jgi:cyclophilin family peptidyl-prolyl cis-trans isomerase